MGRLFKRGLTKIVAVPPPPLDLFIGGSILSYSLCYMHALPCLL